MYDNGYCLAYPSVHPTTVKKKSFFFVLPKSNIYLLTKIFKLYLVVGYNIKKNYILLL